MTIQISADESVVESDRFDLIIPPLFRFASSHLLEEKLKQRAKEKTSLFQLISIPMLSW